MATSASIHFRSSRQVRAAAGDGVSAGAAGLTDAAGLPGTGRARGAARVGRFLLVGSSCLVLEVTVFNLLAFGFGVGAVTSKAAAASSVLGRRPMAV